MSNLKTLKLHTLFNTPVTISGVFTLAQLFNPKTTYFLKLKDNSWVMYQMENNEIFKAPSLVKLLAKTFKIDINEFECYAIDVPDNHRIIIAEIFNLNDNFNLDISQMYKIN